MKVSVASAYEPHRRVIQCACGHARLYRDELAARREGWTCEWVSTGRGPGRRWTCPGCASAPPAQSSAEPTAEPPAFLLELYDTGRHELARAQLELLLEREPARGRAALRAIANRVKRLRLAKRGAWPQWLAELRRAG